MIISKQCLKEVIVVAFIVFFTFSTLHLYKKIRDLRALNLANAGVNYLINASKKHGAPGGYGNSVTTNLNVLTDTDKNWTPDCWTKKTLRILRGTSSVQDFVITSNTNTNIICTTNLPPVGTDIKYAIVLTETLAEGTFTVWYDDETKEIDSVGDEN